MESNWRLNVWKFGCTSLGFRFIARVDAGLYAGFWAAAFPEFGTTTLRLSNPPVDGYLENWFVPFFPRFGRFPYDLTVEPD